VAAALGYGTWRLRQDQFRAGPLVALVQGNLDQRIRNEAWADKDAAKKTMDHYVQLSDLAGSCKPDLIAWPETACPWFWTEQEPGRPVPGTESLARLFAERWKTPVLVGLNAETLLPGGKTRRYNSAVLIGPDAKAHGRYDKVHRVPFGEYVPFVDWLPFMNAFAPYDFDYSVQPGESFTRFQASASGGRDPGRFGVLICYEDTDPGVSRPYGGGDGEAPADFVLNISNDGWFPGTIEQNEHLAICRFRAVEDRRAVGRSVNMGISAMIDSNGRVLAPRPLPVPAGAQPGEVRLWRAEAVPGAEGLPPRQWGEYKEVPGVLLAVVPLDDRTSLYARWGDWLPWGCWALVGAVVLWAVLTRRRVRSPAGVG
jgi:apolipoprotein N-acyltransferase